MAVVTGVTVVSLVSSGLTGPVALADIGGSYVTTANASDPYITTCVNPNTGRAGFCLYTSQDLGIGPLRGNPYPMKDTLLFFSENGVTWDSGRVVLTESQYDWVPDYPYDGPSETRLANHQWAPAMSAGADGQFYLFVPNVSDAREDAAPAPGTHTSSRIGVSRGPTEFGPFEPFDYVRIYDANGNVVEPSYMSDPEVFRSGDRQYLLWADGDGSTCGGISIGGLWSSMSLVGDAKQLRINGVGALGNCGGTGHPYLEGASLFDFGAMTSLPVGLPHRYALVFAAQPTSVPPECATNLGQPNSTNEVIAYATSNSITGDYQYQGIIMCGSGTEFTNQATIAEFRTAGNEPRLVLVYHDGPSGTNHKRKLHAECLMFRDGRFLTTHRTTDGVNWCLQSNSIVSLRSRATTPNRFVATNLDSGANDQYLYSHSDRIGWWEQFELIQRSGGKVALRGRNGRFVTADQAADARPLRANRDVIGAWEEFRVVTNADGTVSLQSAFSQKFVTSDTNNRLRAISNTVGSREKFDLITLYA
jgi:hypothetical protein